MLGRLADAAGDSVLRLEVASEEVGKTNAATASPFRLLPPLDCYTSRPDPGARRLDVFSHWSIRHKLQAVLGLLAVSVPRSLAAPTTDSMPIAVWSRVSVRARQNCRWRTN